MSGGYRDSSDTVRSRLGELERLHEKKAKKRAWLRHVLDDALANLPRSQDEEDVRMKPFITIGLAAAVLVAIAMSFVIRHSGTSLGRSLLAGFFIGVLVYVMLPFLLEIVSYDRPRTEDQRRRLFARKTGAKVDGVDIDATEKRLGEVDAACAAIEAEIEACRAQLRLDEEAVEEGTGDDVPPGRRRA